MNIKPNISGKFGPLTSRGFNAMAKKVNERSSTDTRGDRDARPSVFIAKITAATAVIANRRWKYEWSAAWLNASNVFEAISGSNLTYATQGNIYAYNTVEALQQTSGTYDGPGITHANIPTGFTLQPIANGTYVQMLMSRSADSKMTFTFCVSNAIDGACA